MQSLPIDETMFDSRQQHSQSAARLTTVQLEQSQPHPSSDHVQRPNQDRSRPHSFVQQQSHPPDQQQPRPSDQQAHDSK